MFAVVLGVSVAPIELQRPQFLSPQIPARDLLMAAWQVEAAVLALSAAVAVFAFQVFASERRGMTLTEFAEQSALISLLELGAAALLIAASVLFGWGFGAPGGWAAFVAVCALLLPIALLPPMFRRAIAVLDPSELDDRRRALLAQAIEREVDRAYVLDLGGQIFRRWLVGRLITLHPIRFGSSFGGTRLVAKKSGTVMDVNLSRLASLTKRSTAAGRSVHLFAELGSSVDEGDVLMTYPVVEGSNLERLARSVYAIE